MTVPTMGLLRIKDADMRNDILIFKLCSTVRRASSLLALS